MTDGYDRFEQETQGGTNRCPLLIQLSDDSRRMIRRCMTHSYWGHCWQPTGCFLRPG